MTPRFDTTYRQLPEVFYAPVDLTRAPLPALVRLNRALAEQLGLDPEWLASSEGIAMLSGSTMPPSVEPLAMVYAGHQFGHFNPRLGDGRAMLLGELVGRDGERYDLHLKGSGPTAFSRRGDGKAVLGPVLREYIVSEAMHAFGVPTTRTLAAVSTGERVLRNGLEPGAVLARVARSHVRVGTFQYFLGQDDTAAIDRLANYVIDRHYPEAREAEQPYRALWTCVMERQADLVAHWMALGFIHGVMNTDNTQIAGETIDYGPCAFMDTFHPAKVFSSIDHGGRYAWGNQPNIAIWNLLRLAETLLHGLGTRKEDAIAWAEAQVDAFRARFDAAFTNRFRRKLGLLREADGHDALVDATFSALTEGEVDFTLFFRTLTQVADGQDEAPLRELFAKRPVADMWLSRWRQQLKADGDGDRAEVMRAENPIFIPRNHRIEEAIAAANAGELAPFERLLEVLAKPFSEQPEHAELERPPAPDEIVHQTFCGT